MPVSRQRARGRIHAEARRRRAERLACVRQAIQEERWSDLQTMRVRCSELKEATQTMSRYKDFDEAVADLDPIEFTVKGRRYSIAGDPPCDPMLRALAEGKSTDPRANLEILEAFVGEDNLKQMREDGMGMAQLALLQVYILEQLGFGAEQAFKVLNEDAEEADPAGNGSRSPMSSSIGER